MVAFDPGDDELSYVWSPESQNRSLLAVLKSSYLRKRKNKSEASERALNPLLSSCAFKFMFGDKTTGGGARGGGGSPFLACLK